MRAADALIAPIVVAVRSGVAGSRAIRVSTRTRHRGSIGPASARPALETQSEASSFMGAGEFMATRVLLANRALMPCTVQLPES